MASSPKLKAREYLRVSQDRSGRVRSVNEQHQDHQGDAKVHGWTLGVPYRDVGSASRYTTKARGGFTKLIGDLRADRFAAAILILWEGSRGSRQVSEWVELIELCEKRSVRIWVHTHGTLYDPANPRHRRTLLEDAIDSEYESSKTSGRTARAARASAKDGKPGSRCAFGYTRRYHPKTRALIEQVELPDEARVVREVFDRIVRGHSLREIAADLNRRGIRRRTGKPFSPQHLRDLATRQTYAGRRVHHPRDRTGRKIGKAAVYDGTWSPIVPPTLFDRVQRILTAPERKTTRPGRATHLLSMIAVCDVCDGPIATAIRRGRWCYWCHRGGHVLVPKVDLDSLAEQVMLTYLARDDVYAALTAHRPDDAETEKIRQQIEEARIQLDELRDAVAAGSVTVASLARAEPQLETRIADLETREREASTPPDLVGLIHPGRDVANRWAAMPVSARRRAARILLTPELLGQLRVARSPVPGRPAPIEERVTWQTDPGRARSR